MSQKILFYRANRTVLSLNPPFIPNYV